jgi:hypothetical protein
MEGAIWVRQTTNFYDLVWLTSRMVFSDNRWGFSNNYFKGRESGHGIGERVWLTQCAFYKLACQGPQLSPRLEKLQI